MYHRIFPWHCVDLTPPNPPYERLEIGQNMYTFIGSKIEIRPLGMPRAKRKQSVPKNSAQPGRLASGQSVERDEPPPSA